MYADITDLFRLIPMVISYIAMGAMSVMVLYNDFKRLSVKMWMLFLLILFAFAGVIVGRVAAGTFEWYWLLIFPVYILLNVLNTFLNHNRIIGQADVDILNGTISIVVPTFMYIVSKSYDNYTSSVHLIQITGILGDLSAWLLIGFLVALITSFVRWVIYKIAHRGDKSVSDVVKGEAINVSIKAMNPQKVIKDSVDNVKSNLSKDVKSTDESEKLTDIKEKNQLQDQGKLRGRKIPVCLSFIPMLYAAVFIGIYITL